MRTLFRIAEVTYEDEDKAAEAHRASPDTEIFAINLDAPECERAWVKVHPAAPPAELHRELEETPAETPSAKSEAAHAS